MQRIIFMTSLAVFFSLLGVHAPMSAEAHCDRVNGPVANDARKALQSGQLESVAIWVGQEQMAELRDVFEQSLGAYQMGGKAKDVAEQYFMSTAVRLHRQAEGFPFHGLKPAQPLPKDVALAEKALETGNLQPVTGFLASEMQSQTERLFQQVLEKQKNKDKSVETGREWADAYVKYITFVHDLHQNIESGPPHGVAH